MTLAVAVAPVTDQSQTFSDRVVPVVIGALIALAGTVLVQLWLVPRVDSRKRRTQRWEDDVLALGQLLAFDHAEAASDMRLRMLAAFVWLADRPDDADPQRWEAIVRQDRERLSEASEVFQRLPGRVRWLADRVTSVAPHSAVLGNLAHLSRRYEIEHSRVGFLSIGSTAPTEAEIQAACDALAKVAGDMQTRLRGLATGRLPRNSLRRYLRWRNANRAGKRAKRSRA